MKHLILSTICAGLLLLPSANASIISVSNPGALGANDTINWSDLGPSFTTVANPTNGTTTGSLGYTVSQAGNDNFERRDQNNGWAGNFAHGAPVLWTHGPSGPITIAFAGDVFGAGAKIQADFFGAFVARIQAFDSGLNLLGQGTFDGNSTFDGDDSAIFIGLLSNTANIRSIVFSLDSASTSPEDFAIGNVGVNTAGVVVPEPGTGTLVSGVLAVAGVAMLRRKKA
jgi:hypothetical protein